MDPSRSSNGHRSTKAVILDDPAHPALRGQYAAAGAVQRINYFREQRKPWEAVEIYLTLRCPLACAHCITNSHPGRRGSIDAGLLDSLIAGFAALPDTRYVCLFGGEPFLEPGLLRGGIRAVLESGMVPSVVSSGYWGRSQAEIASAVDILRGVDRLLISADRHHEVFLSIETTMAAATAARASGIKTTICYTAEPDEFAGESELPDDLLEICRREDIGIVVTPLSDAGRAAGCQEMIPAVSASAGCGKLDVPLVDIHGNVFACGPGWTIPREGESRHLLGRFPGDSLEEMLRRRLDAPLFQAINDEGPMAALERLAYDSPERRRDLVENPPRTPCGACQQMSRWLADDDLPHWRREFA